MDETVFAAGVPAKITVADFRRHHLASFPKLAEEKFNELIQEAIDTVYGMFTGVAKLWDLHDRKTWYEKTTLCYRLLTAWYITDMHPGFAAGVPAMGGIPVKRKKVDGVDITFSDSAETGIKGYVDMLSSLSSNPWGNKAKLMIQTAAKRAMPRNCRFV